ncbi:sigma-70 family RNA polymerase sigma factor [Candidatus Bipolaricaulota bacterium]|nr:sigma-70 family RNA polymerase sigma factor [Candidatus Bipolaricaulota bacterium]
MSETRAVIDDQRLLSLVAAGKDEAFHRFYDEYANRVFRYALTLLRSRHLAEEVVQETMIAVWRSASKYAGLSKVSTWVFGIARNKAFGLLRREERGSRHPDIRLVEPDPADAISREQRVLHALNTLSQEQREVVFLAFYEGLAYQEVAQLLDIPEGTVKSRMYHAKRKLAEVLA